MKVLNNKWELLHGYWNIIEKIYLLKQLSVYSLCPVLFIRCWQPIIDTSIPHSVCFIYKCCSQYCFDNEKVSILIVITIYYTYHVTFPWRLIRDFKVELTIKDTTRVNFYYLKHYKWKVAKWKVAMVNKMAL